MRGGAARGGVRGGAVCDGGAVRGTGRTGMRSTAPHAHPSSGCGHWSWRPHAPQRTVTQVSVQVRCVIRSGAAPRNSGGASGSPHAQGKTGGVKVCWRRHAGQRTGTFSPMTVPLRTVGDWHVTGM
ncbi:hypothetical protein GCM10010446_10390 [Streptomyces enissocaesilis]|uniref:Uncharacterized protein n=1 Tax=Streptomyces enissocaesilis TaxID=332589 RepID=A0ABP6JEF7_9ACTN